MKNERIPIIGLAGGIGAGKSSVARMLEEMGCLVSDSDAGAKAALRDPHIKATISRWWGDQVLDQAGEIDRSAVARIVFNDPAERRRLESLTHPWIEARRKEEFAAAPPGIPALVIDAPLLFEAGLDQACDAVIFIDAGPSVRRERVRRNRGWSVAELSRREKSQLPLDEKRSRADYVVTNNGDLGELKTQVRLALNTIVESCRP